MKNIVKTLNTITIGITSLAAITVFLLTALFLAGCPTEEEQTGEKRAVDIAAIEGVTAPFIGETPVRTITSTIQYTGTVKWYGDLDANGNFIEGIEYTAIITLKAAGGYTLEGVGENFFTVAGANTSNSANSGNITAKFPMTRITTVNIKDIPGVTVPVVDGTPGRTIKETAQYTGSVMWKDAAGNSVTGSFATGQIYTATITLTAKTGYTMEGVGVNFFAVAGADKVSNPVNTGSVTAVFPKASKTIDMKDIPVTFPATGKTPIKTITSTTQYTGDVSWKDAAGNSFTGAFAGGQSYTATITLKVKDGYTVQGVTANSFTVEGAKSVTNLANSGVITVTFPATLTPVTIKAISGVTAPVVTETPVRTITPTDQYTGEISWKTDGGIPLTGAFDGGKTYIATITLTLKEGYTLTGVAANFFTVAGARPVTNTASSGLNSGVINATFPATLTPVTIKDIKGIYPVAGEKPLTAIPSDSSNNEYTSKITWKNPTGTNFTADRFAAGTAYTATITLTAKTGYTLQQGIPANYFTVEMATSTRNIVNSGVITAEFPSTGGTDANPIKVNIRNVTFDPKPVSGVLIGTVNVVETLQYTKHEVRWDTNDIVFDKQKPVSADITLTAKKGFTFTGVAQDYFTVDGQRASNDAIPAVVPPAPFPIFGNDKITIKVTFLPSEGTVSTKDHPIKGIIVPKFTPSAGTGTGSLVTTEINKDTQYTGTVTWYEKGKANVFLGKTFGPGMEYTAKIELKATPGYTFKGVVENSFIVEGANNLTASPPAKSVSNPAGTGDSIVVTVVYNETAAIPITISKIKDVVFPKAGVIPSQIPLDNSEQFYAVITWSTSDPFFAGLVYGAVITVTPKPGFTLQGVANNFFTVTNNDSAWEEKGLKVRNLPNSGNIEVTFPPTESNPDKTISLKAPAAGELVSVIGTSEQYTGTVTWSPNPTSGMFAAGTVYTATITLTLKSGFTFYGVPANYFVVPGTSEPATNSAGSGVITAKFPATDTTVDIKAIQGVIVPVAGATPVTTITETAQYRGTVAWKVTASDGNGTALNPEPSAQFVFAADTAYTATITLTAKPGYTFYGITKENFFTVAGSSPAAKYTQVNDKGVITASFKETATTVTIKNIQGITVPVENETPKINSITGTDGVKTQYTGTVAWKYKDSAFNGKFVKGEEYTVEITLDIKTGFTLYNLDENSFQVMAQSAKLNGNKVTCEFTAEAAQ